MPPLDCRPRNSRSKLLNPFSGLDASRLAAGSPRWCVWWTTAIPPHRCLLFGDLEHVTAVVEDHMSHVNDRVRAAIAYNVCGANTSAKLSKADWKPYALIKKMLQIEHKLAKENAETNGWNVTEETTAVTEQFCAAVKNR